MIDVCDLAFYFSIVLFMMLFLTGAYKRSYSTATIIVFLPLIVWVNSKHIEYVGNILSIIVATFLLIRAIINQQKDKLIKRG